MKRISENENKAQLRLLKRELQATYLHKQCSIDDLRNLVKSSAAKTRSQVKKKSQTNVHIS